jgi:hypothetical protein
MPSALHGAASPTHLIRACCHLAEASTVLGASYQQLRLSAFWDQGLYSKCAVAWRSELFTGSEYDIDLDGGTQAGG